MFAIAHGGRHPQKPLARYGRESYETREEAEKAITPGLRKKFPDIRVLTESYVEQNAPKPRKAAAPAVGSHPGIADQVLEHLITDGQIEIGHEAERLDVPERAVRRALERLRSRGQDARPIGRRVFALKPVRKSARRSPA